MDAYCTEHIFYIIISIIVMALSIILLKKFLKKDKLSIYFKIMAIFSLILIIINRIVVSKSRSGTFIDFIPDTFCSTMGFIVPIVVLFFKPTTKTFQYAIFAGFFGGAITFFYPDFLIYFDNFFNIHPFTGMLYHTLMLYYFISSIALGYYKPTFKNWSSFLIGLAFMIVYAEIGNSVLGQSNNMYLNKPLLSGTPLTWYLVGLLTIVTYTFIIQIYEMCTLPFKEWTITRFFGKFKHKNIKQSTNETELEN